MKNKLIITAILFKLIQKYETPKRTIRLSSELIQGRGNPVFLKTRNSKSKIRKNNKKIQLIRVSSFEFRI